MPKQQELGLGARLARRPARRDAGRPRGPNPNLWHRSRDEFSAAHPTARDAPRAARDSVAAGTSDRARRRGGVPARVRAEGVPARPLLAPGRSRAPDRRGRRRRGARARDEVDRVEVRVRGESRARARAQREGARGPLSPRGAHLPAAGAERARLRAAQRAPARGEADRAAAEAGQAREAARARARDRSPRRRGAGSTAGGTDARVDRSPPRLLGTEPAVAPPRTWFLRVGWRKHALIDPSEIPALARG